MTRLRQDRAVPTRWARLFSFSRAGVLLLLAGHGLACVGTLALMGDGHAWGSASGIAYRLLPILFLLAIAFATAAPARWDATAHLLRLLMCVWLCVGAAVLARFPVTGPRLSAACAAAAVVVGLALAASTGGPARLSRTTRILCWASSIGAASLVAWSAILVLAAPPASTRSVPLDQLLAAQADSQIQWRNVKLGPAVSVDLPGATVVLSNGKRVVYIEPLLTFNQRSPDGCWTIFASRRDRQAVRHNLSATHIESGACSATYDDTINTDDDHQGVSVAEHRLKVAHRANDSVDITATSHLARPIYSHLNTFTQVTVAGHGKLSVAFSPAPDRRIDVRARGYPVGAPARFAYVDGANTFRVVEAASAEKGPFTELASGLVENDLTMTLFDDDKAFLEIVLRDFVRQASVEPSPSAGWGVPQNAIEFSLDSDRPGSAAMILVSLASTSVGRGWQSVGHAAGVYENRISVCLPVNTKPVMPGDLRDAKGNAEP